MIKKYEEFNEEIKEKFDDDFLRMKLKLQVDIDRPLHLYLQHLINEDGRTARWYVAKALEKYFKEFKE